MMLQFPQSPIHDRMKSLHRLPGLKVSDKCMAKIPIADIDEYSVIPEGWEPLQPAFASQSLQRWDDFPTGTLRVPNAYQGSQLDH